MSLAKEDNTILAVTALSSRDFSHRGKSAAAATFVNPFCVRPARVEGLTLTPGVKTLARTLENLLISWHERRKLGNSVGSQHLSFGQQVIDFTRASLG